MEEAHFETCNQAKFSSGVSSEVVIVDDVDISKVEGEAVLEAAVAGRSIRS